MSEADIAQMARNLLVAGFSRVHTTRVLCAALDLGLAEVYPVVRRVNTRLYHLMIV